MAVGRKGPQRAERDVREQNTVAAPPAWGERLIASLSNHRVMVTSNFTGEELVLFGGVWADRLPRHRIMIGADAVRCALHTGLAVLIFTGAVQIWQLVVIEAGFGAAEAFLQPAYSGLLPQTVSEELIQDARALTESTSNSS